MYKNKTQRQIFENKIKQKREKLDEIYVEMLAEFREGHKEMVGKNHDVEFNSDYNWDVFLSNYDKRYRNRIGKVNCHNYQNTNGYRKWNHLINTFRNVVKYDSNRKYKNALAMFH